MKHAYATVFRSIGTLYRLCTLPHLVATLAGIAFPIIASAYLSRGFVAPLPPLLQFLPLALAAVQLLCGAIILSATHRLFLFDDRRPGVLLPLSFDRAQLYFIAIPIVAALAWTAFTIAGAVATSLVVGTLFGPSGIAGLVSFLMGLAISAWLFCRLVSLLPLIVATNRLAIRRAWRESRGHAWRILGVLAAGLLPVAVVFLAVGYSFIRLVLPAPGTSPEAVRELLSTERILALSLINAAVTVVIAVPAAGIFSALLCNCFKALSGYPPDTRFLPPDP